MEPDSHDHDHIMHPGMWLSIAGIAAIAYGLMRRGTPQPQPGPRRIAAVGDSITVSGLYLREAMANLPPGSRGRVFAMGGKGARKIGKIALPEALRWAPTDVIILAGVNDLMSARGPKYTLRHLRKMYADAHRAGARVIAVMVTPWAGYRLSTPEFQRETREVNAAIAQEAVTVVDTTFLGDTRGRLRPEYSLDTIHLSEAGNRALGAAIAARL